MLPMRQKAAVENAETEAVISGARSLAPMRQNVKGYENSAFGVPAIKQIETYKLKRRKGIGNFSIAGSFFGLISTLGRITNIKLNILTIASCIST